VAVSSLVLLAPSGLLIFLYVIFTNYVQIKFTLLQKLYYTIDNNIIISRVLQIFFYLKGVKFMSTMADQTHDENLREIKINFSSFEKYIKSFDKNDLGAKIYFNDGTYIKGFIVNTDTYNIFLMHKKNVIAIPKGNVKMIEPLVDTEDKEKKKNNE